MLWVPPADEGIGTFTANDTVTRLTAVLLVDTTQHTGDFVEQCQREIDFEVEYNNWTDPPTYCLVAEWSYDVGANAPVSENTDEVCLTPEDMVSLDGRQITKAVTNSRCPAPARTSPARLCGRGRHLAAQIRRRQQRGATDSRFSSQDRRAFVPLPRHSRRDESYPSRRVSRLQRFLVPSDCRSEEARATRPARRAALSRATVADRRGRARPVAAARVDPAPSPSSR